MVSMAMTPQVVLSCLGSWTLVCNTVFAHLILKETVSRPQAAAVLSLVFATAMVLYNAPRPEPGEDRFLGDVDALTDRFISPEFEAMTALLLGSIGICLTFALGLSCASKEASPTNSRECMDEDDLIGVTSRTCLPASWAAAAAVAAGYTALLFKCIAELLAQAASDQGASAPWSYWETYVILGVALSCAPTELHCLNVALASGEAVFVVPAYLGLSMLSQLTTGAVFFREYNDFRSTAHALGFGVSVALVLSLVVVLAQVSMRRDTVDEDIPLDPEVIAALDATQVPPGPPPLPVVEPADAGPPTPTNTPCGTPSHAAALGLPLLALGWERPLRSRVETLPWTAWGASAPLQRPVTKPGFGGALEVFETLRDEEERRRRDVSPLRTTRPRYFFEDKRRALSTPY